jgi:hypothetical protein
MTRIMYGIFLQRFAIAALTVITIFISIPEAGAQNTGDTLDGRNLYNPARLKLRDTVIITEPAAENQKMIKDTLDLRMKFIQDSILAREQFVRDSILRRQRQLDSLKLLKTQLNILLHAYLLTVREDIIGRQSNIEITGDSVLGDYKYLILPFNINQPFTPWKIRLGLSGNQMRVVWDKAGQKITAAKAPFMNCSFAYNGDGSIIVINELPVIQNDRTGQFYKTPVDSVFYDRNGRVVKIKKYIQFYSIVNNIQRGAPLFLNLAQVKQYEYGPDNGLKKLQLVSFCDRWKSYEPVKVCTIVTYELSKKNNTYLLVRHNDPANNYSDGTYAFEFDDNENLKSVSFNNSTLTESWQRSVELNADGNVNCYVDRKKDMVVQSQCMIYHLKETGAKYPVETITTTYEEDGVSYFQRNNTTGLIRNRDRMTMEWGPWK